eukprot:TRINITY_DN105506_c0_g1_i1.p2 TRINITY_DN105506_c0_g1~~TRINITY_DN105506_c0_g1_i1.p2  ORF type:complete len:305 (+),score=77.27 TRINITY_DN105506_c0_g1_i1:478-1392(+)
MLATLTHDVFSDPAWIYDRKLDGERCLVLRSGDKVELFSRNQKKLNAHYPELVDALRGQKASRFIADGEIVAFEDGLTSFSRLQKRMQIKNPDRARASGVAVYLYLFDLMHLGGRDLRPLGQRRRKSLLREALEFDDPLRYVPHRNQQGEEYYELACRRGWEGLIAKRAEAPYHNGRTRDWLKFKCLASQELVVVGYTDPAGQREGFGALLLGYYRDSKLRYAGKVGTGFDQQELELLANKLHRLERKRSPLTQPVMRGGVHWVSPKLVAEVHFTEWTDAGRLRHPSFKGLRWDKDPKQVVREG